MQVEASGNVLKLCIVLGIRVIILRLGAYCVASGLFAQKRKEEKALDSSRSWDQWLLLHCSAQCRRGPITSSRGELNHPIKLYKFNISTNAKYGALLTVECDFCGVS